MDWKPPNGSLTSHAEAYRRSDIVMVDNHRIGHGREIYLGPKTSRLKHGNARGVWTDSHIQMKGDCCPLVTYCKIAMENHHL